MIAEAFPAGRLAKDAAGRPRILDNEGSELGFVSISHSRNILAVGIARHPIGIDIEKFDAGRMQRSGPGLVDALAERVEGCTTVTTRNFYAVWTAYEAAFKAGSSLKALLSGEPRSSVLEVLPLANEFVFALAMTRAS